MPLYYYRCAKCDRVDRNLLSVEDSKLPQACKECSETMERSPEPPSVRATEILDNGFMPRRIERLVNAEALFKDRANIKKGIK